MTELAMGTELTREQRDYLETVKLSADSLLNVINDILDFSKIDSGKMEIEQQDFNLRGCIDGVLDLFYKKANQAGLKLSCWIEEGVPEVIVGDALRLRQVLINLVSNAVKFTHFGLITLRVGVESIQAREVCLHFTVKDTGIGIPEDKRELIFHAFSQADESMTRSYGGTGLGLTISARLVALMGGRIWLESELGHGSTFHFTACLGLPQHAPGHASVLPESAPADARAAILGGSESAPAGV